MKSLDLCFSKASLREDYCVSCCCLFTVVHLAAFFIFDFHAFYQFNLFCLDPFRQPGLIILRKITVQNNFCRLCLASTLGCAKPTKTQISIYKPYN